MNTTQNLTPTEKALIALGLTPVAHEDVYAGRADDEVLAIRCGRCGGSGIISAYIPVNGGECFGCGGAGVERNTTVGEERRRDRETVNRMNRKMLRNEKERAARVAKADAERAEAETKRAAFLAANEGLEDALAALPGDFGVSLRASLATKGTLTEKQVAAALRVAAEVTEREEKATPVVEGRGVIAGIVRSVKTVDTDFGTTFKMIVEDDRGFRLYGTVPNAILDDVEAGSRVEFTARAEASNNDPAFGFYSRPSKARLV